MFLSKSFEKNKNMLDDIFKNCNDVKCLDVNMKYLDEVRGRIYFLEETVSDITIKKVLYGLTDVEKVAPIENAIKGVMIGNAILILEGEDKAL